MQWFQIKEQSAGEKRLLLSWYLYKIFGKRILYIIAFLVSFFTFVFSPKVREYSRKYLNVIKNETNIKPDLVNQFRHIYSYADSLADKMLVYVGDFEPENIFFDNEEDKKQLFEDIDNGQGVFFICNHIGNIEILQSYFFDKITKPNFNINIFMSNKQSQIFNGFIKQIKVDFPVRLFPIEEIGLCSGIELKENLSKGEVIFIAGDRVSENNSQKCIASKLFSHKINLPKGTFKLANLMEVPTYFISAVKYKNKYKVYLEKQPNLSETNLVQNYIEFLGKMIKITPLQFYNFYDFFNN